MSDDEDIDDSMAANPEPPRHAPAYGDIRGPRRRGRDEERGRWVMEWVAEDQRQPEPAQAAKVCEMCRAEVRALFSLHPSIKPTACGKCQGIHNRNLMNEGSR